MTHQESPDSQVSSGPLVQSMGGVYLLMTMLMLFVIAVLTLGGTAIRTHLTRQPVPEAHRAAPDSEERKALYAKLAKLGDELAADAAERNRLALQLEKLLAVQSELTLRVAEAKSDAAHTDERASLLRAIEEIERELAAVSMALEASERRVSSSQMDVSGLGTRLNRALLIKVEDLQRSRSEFFARLRDVLGSRPDFKVEGDRFALPSEVLFAPGSDRLLPQGLEEVRRLAATINAIKSEFPAGLNWVLRVGGHTDKRPISNARFPSNWELSSLRAVTVVKALVAAGIPPEHVAAAGFGEFQPVSAEEDEPGYARNRRIEFRLDQP